MLDIATETAAAQATVGPATVPNDTLVKIFIRIRDAKSSKKKEMEAEIDKLDQQLKTISAELKSRCMEANATSLKTEMGTVYISETMKVSCGDWGVFYGWIKDNDALDMLEQRVKAGEVKKYMDDHKGELPPGISIFKETEARIRKPTKRGGAVSEDDTE